MRRPGHKLFDKTLTPENAKERGYAWIRDLPYGKTLEEAQEQIRLLELAHTMDYILGKCKYDIKERSNYATTGLYKRLTKSEKIQTV